MAEDKIEERDLAPDFRKTYTPVDAFIATQATRKDELSALCRAGDGTSFSRMLSEYGTISDQGDQMLAELARTPNLLSTLQTTVKELAADPALRKSTLVPERHKLQNVTFALTACLSHTPLEQVPAEVRATIGEPVSLPWQTTVAQEHGYISTYDTPERNLEAYLRDQRVPVLDGVLAILPKPPANSLDQGKQPYTGLTIKPIKTETGVIAAGTWLDVIDPETTSVIDAVIDEATGKKDGEPEFDRKKLNIKTAPTDGNPLRFGLARPALPAPSDYGTLTVETLVQKAATYADALK